MCRRLHRPRHRRGVVADAARYIYSLRDRLVAERLRCTNQAGGLLAERGCVAAKGQKGFDELMAGIHERDDAEVTRPLLQMLELIGDRIEHIDQQLRQILN